MVKDTSWNKISGWYHKSVGRTGSFYHQEVVLPNVVRLLDLKPKNKLLDIGCGQGVLERAIDKLVEYLGIDLSEKLIGEARKQASNKHHQFIKADASKKINISWGTYDKAAIILALQNMAQPQLVLKNVARALKPGGELVVVLNHPMFRIPKHADWEVDRQKGVQYRRVDSYMSQLEIPIDSSPFNNKNNERTWSYHHPLSSYTKMLMESGLWIKNIEEWVSPKKSEGGMAKVEDKARKEIPMFMALVVVKVK